MFCRNCGSQIHDGADVCLNCGVRAGAGVNFCPNCGVKVNPEQAVCLNCGCSLGYNRGYANYNPFGMYKSKLVAGLLGIFLGGLGIHNFYLGYNTKAVIQIVVSIVGGLLTCGVASAAVGIWGLVEGVLILCDVITVDGKGNPLRE